MEDQLLVYRSRLRANQDINDHLVRINGHLIDADKEKRQNLAAVMESEEFQALKLKDQRSIAQSAAIDPTATTLLTRFLDLLREQRENENQG